jgi:hypothetical protein
MDGSLLFSIPLTSDTSCVIHVASLEIPGLVWKLVEGVVDPEFGREVHSYFSLGESLDKAVFGLITASADAVDVNGSALADEMDQSCL